MENQKNFYIAASVVLLVVAVGGILFRVYTKPKPIESFEDCVKQGNPISETYPATCTVNGKTYTQTVMEAKPAPKANPNIQVTSPQPNDHVTSPLSITGQAKGWYFEASFPVKLLDQYGNVLAQGPAQATGNWMTTSFVPFTASLTYAATATGTGTLVFEKDNPSGEPANADSYSFTVTY